MLAAWLCGWQCQYVHHFVSRMKYFYVYWMDSHKILYIRCSQITYYQKAAKLLIILSCSSGLVLITKCQHANMQN